MILRTKIIGITHLLLITQLGIQTPGYNSVTRIYSHEIWTTNQIRRSYKNDQSINSWLYYCVSWNYNQNKPQN